MMNDTLNIIETSALPERLKEYFNGSKKIQKVITEELIEDIEDLYLYYESVYHFKLSEFGVCVIDSLMRCKDFSSYYFYLKKILEKQLEVELRDKDNSFMVDLNLISAEFKKSASEILKLLSETSDERLFQLNFHVGRLNVIQAILEDDYYIDLYEDLIRLIDNHL